MGLFGTGMNRSVVEVAGTTCVDIIEEYANFEIFTPIFTPK